MYNRCPLAKRPPAEPPAGSLYFASVAAPPRASFPARFSTEMSQS
jgi:hypothetical protein